MRGRLKRSTFLDHLYEHYSFGILDGHYLIFTERDRDALIKRVQSENGAHLFRDAFPEKQSRPQVAQHQRNEKQGSYAVSRDFILLNALQPLLINNQQISISPFTSLGLYLKADEILSVEHPLIVMVENLAIMANLSALNIPESLQSALWLYRGDIKKQQQTSSAYQFFRRFIKTHQLICFSDLDPKGIEIALTSGAQYWLTAEDDLVINMQLQGEENEWFNQASAVKYLQEQTNLSSKCQSAFNNMCEHRKTLKQEHMLKHDIKLDLYSL